MELMDTMEMSGTRNWIFSVMWVPQEISGKVVYSRCVIKEHILFTNNKNIKKYLARICKDKKNN